MPCYRVTVIVANVKQYRKLFYSQLRDVLGPYRIQLTVLYSDPDPVEHKKADSIDLSPPLGKKIARFFIWNNRVLLQMLALKDVAKSDLIIIVQSTGYLVNYPLLLLSALGLKRIAFWGHGYNRQGRSGALSERIKRRLANASDWWFAYTQETARYLCSAFLALISDQYLFRVCLLGRHDLGCGEGETTAPRIATVVLRPPVGLRSGSCWRGAIRQRAGGENREKHVA